MKKLLVGLVPIFLLFGSLTAKQEKLANECKLVKVSEIQLIDTDSRMYIS